MSESSIESFPQDPSSRALGTAARRSGRSGDSEPARVAGTVEEERALVAQTLAGDSSAFGALVDRHHASFLRLACAWGHDEAAAQEVVSASWSAILDGLGRFPFNCSLRTWMMRIVAVCAARRNEDVPAPRRNARADDPKHEKGTERFNASGGWTDPPARWDEQSLMNDEVTSAVEASIVSLPFAERAVLTLRDVEGMGAEDTCAVLDLCMSRQRLLLHRGRERVWRALDQHLRDRAHLRTATTG